VISTPVTVVSGVTAAAKNGVLIKGGLYLEAMGNVKALALDKTGTLTHGQLEVVSVLGLGGISDDEALALAAAIESRSEHPIGRAIVEAAEERRIPFQKFDVCDFTSIPGQGARADLDGENYVVGKPTFVQDGEGALPPAEFTQEGRTVVGLSRAGQLVAWIALADQPRENAGEAVRRLKKAGVRHVVMVTGDNQQTAEAVGRSVGLQDIRAGLLPEEKVSVIRALETEWGSVAMVGDGVNDGPALAVATVGVAMGAVGSDVALETADIALMGDDLSRIPYLYTLSRRARRVIRQNIVTAIGVKAILALGVPLGMVPLVAAVVIGDMGVSFAVTLNALRLAHLRP
jgi:Cd2+/Zn2+-exporting ATPase